MSEEFKSKIKVQQIQGGMQTKKKKKVNMKLRLPQLSKTFAWEYFWFGLMKGKKLLWGLHFVNGQNLVFEKFSFTEISEIL